MGHVYRCLAIADVLRANMRAEIAFLMSAAHPAGIRTVEGHGYAVRRAAGADAGELLAAVREAAPHILINDLPDLDPAYLRELARLPTTTVNLVDGPDALESAEEAQHLIVSLIKEERETPEGFFGGPEYAILRAHFGGAAKEVRARAERVLLSFGGSDPQGLTLKAARALGVLPPEVEVVAVAGPAFSHRREFEALASSLPRRVPLVDREGAHIADLMLEADVVVGSGGMSVYELAALGTPGVVLGQNAREDKRMREFARHGTVEYLGLGPEVEEGAIGEAVRALLADAGRRRAMSERGRALVDGRGAARTAEMVLERRRRPRVPVPAREDP
jgi:spore coat polysaccharide biosynthesis protein SpsF